MDFGALPPEVNSALIYAGAGAAPLLAAGAAWNGVAAELSAAASSFESVITRLTTEEWMSPASRSMAAAAQPFSIWLSYTAECSAVAAAQAMASAAAFETALATTVPPAEVAANRALLADLMSTNTFGQNVSAIAATEARYGEMWAQDAAAMYSYAASSAAAGRLNPLTNPSPVADPAGIATQAGASAQQTALGTLVSNGPDAVMGLSSPATSAAPTSAGGIIGVLSAIDGFEHPGFETGNHLKAVYADFGANMENVIPLDDGDDAEEAADASHVPVMVGLGPSAVPPRVGAAPIVAGSGTALSVGHLSVPASWPTAPPPPTATAAGTGWTAPEEDESNEFAPPVPGMGAAINGARALPVPRYGVKPIVMPTRGAF